MTLSTAKLQLHTNDKFKRSLKTSCTIKMDNGVDTFNDFVAVGYNPATGKTTMLKNTDAMTLAQAYMMVGKAFKEAMAELTPEMRKDIMDCLEVTI